METVLLLGLGPTALTALGSLAERFQVTGLIRACPPTGGQDEVIDRAHALGVPLIPDVGVAGVERAAGKGCCPRRARARGREPLSPFPVRR